MKFNVKELLIKVKSFGIKCKRVWLILRKPTKKEFVMVAKVSAIGIAILGFLGFLIAIIMKEFVR